MLEASLIRSTALVVVAFALLSLSTPRVASAQTMQEVLSQLFVFSTGDDPLFLAGPNNAHGNHFIPAAVESNGALLGVLTSTIANNIANFPLSSTVSSETFRFVDGVPTPTSNSFGPIFAERAQTLGRGRFDVGFSYSSIGFDRIRGIPMDDIELVFVHENVTGAACDAAVGGDCDALGLPTAEHDLIELGLDLAIGAEIFAFNSTFGVTDWLDVGIAVPVIKLEIDGGSVAQVSPSQIDNPAHFFGGTQADPDFGASSSTRGSTSGIGDVAARTKIRLLDGAETDIAILGEVRIPTGREEDFLGTGEVFTRGMFVGSATLGAFAPHLNFGYIHRGGEDESDSFQLAAGFDQRLSDWSTFVIDLLGDFKTGDPLEFPQSVQFAPPLERTVSLSNVPNLRDDTIDLAVGLKMRSQGGVVLWSNALIALNDGGMRSDVIATFGLQFSSR